MVTDAGRAELTGAANQMMRRALNELDGLRARAARHADEVRALREGVRKTLTGLEREARQHADSFTPRDLGQELRLDLTHAYGAADLPGSRAPEPPPTSLDAARREWNELAAFTEQEVRSLIAAKSAWDYKTFKRRSSMPMVPVELWRATQRLLELHTALPALRERYVVERFDTKAHLNGDLAAEIERRSVGLAQAFAAAGEVFAEVENNGGLTSASWGSSVWMTAEPARALRRILRIGELEPALPQSSGIGRLPVFVGHPLTAGVSIAADVAHRQSAIDLARSLILRMLAATPPGDVRFLFVDPVSLGQAVAEFRHLAEFDPRLVDAKTWTSEREIETRLDELASHLEVVISTYLRGQFESIDEYNRHAGEVAEPYRVLVVFDYPTGFSSRSARQLLSLIENGVRCGVHVIVHHDPSRPPPDEVPLARLTHSMQKVDLTRERARITLPEPIGAIDLDFLPDACPPVSFSVDGQPTSPAAQLLRDIGVGSRTSLSGPVTIERVMPILNKLVAGQLSGQVPRLRAGAADLLPADPGTWWAGLTAAGACAPIGRAGAQDLASLYFSSTEVAGGAIVVGLPRTGKSTALHAAIVSLSMIYPPDELELYLVDSKHGVEFKVYDELPHARLVSINSEREFSVNVLQSLDGEIKRRANLMKRETAGKANITEYRAATGRPMPRIVLFMDEFHELFEEDDALGQAAFQAFSNIVRQGPFAGVHVVVASQTMSSMPAMDRSTLSLLPMRVAFMCNESDADLVMGDLNRDVKALSRQGEGIFNPARGEPSYNKPFRGTYVPPNERDALLAAVRAKAATSGITRCPRVFDGDKMALRPAELPSITATRPVFAIGEPFSLDASLTIALRRGRGANVLLLGPAGEEADADMAVAGALHSCLAGAISSGMTAHVIDFIGDAEPDGALDVLGLCEALGARYRRASGLLSAFEEMLAEIAARREADDYRRPGVLLALNGVHRAFDLTPEDPYADAEEDPDLGRLLADLLRDGPEVGCHTVLLIDGLAQFDRRLGRDLLKEFGWRIAGSDLSSNDVSAASESFNEREIRQGQLLVVDAGSAKTRRVRAYPRYSDETIPTPNDRTSS